MCQLIERMAKLLFGDLTRSLLVCLATGTASFAQPAAVTPTRWVDDRAYPDPYGFGAPFFSEVPGGAPSATYKTSITNFPVETHSVSYYNPGFSGSHSAIYFQGNDQSSIGTVGANNSFFVIALAGTRVGPSFGGNFGSIDHTDATLPAMGHTLEITVSGITISPGSDDVLQIMWMLVTDEYLQQYGANGQVAIFLSSAVGQTATFDFTIPFNDPRTGMPISTVDPNLSFEIVNYSTHDLQYTISIKDISLPSPTQPTPPPPPPPPPPYPYVGINDPFATGGTWPYGINNSGEIVGPYYAIINNVPIGHGFLYRIGTFSLIDLSKDNAISTTPYGINSAGQIVGSYTTGGISLNPLRRIHGFLYDNGTWTTLDNPSTADNALGVAFTEAHGINDSGQVVGAYTDGMAAIHGFLYENGTWTTLDDPSAADNASGVAFTQAYGINDSGQIVGYFGDSNASAKGFVYSSGSWTTLSNPSAGIGSQQGTFPRTINNSGQIVGYYIDANGAYHGFLYAHGTWTTVNVPTAEQTRAFGINNSGQIVGWYQGSTPHGQGFSYPSGR
jgi:probable HAF family extracellular repeat protein